MIKPLRLLLFLMLMVVPVYGQTGPGSVQPSSPTTGNAQNAATADGNGTPFPVRFYGSAQAKITIAGTGTVNFEGQPLSGAAWEDRYGYLKTDSTKTLVKSTTSSGTYFFDLAGDENFRGRISGCSACTVTVTIKGVPATARVGAPTGGGIIVAGTTPITGGTTSRVLFDNAGVVGEDADFTFLTDTLTVTKAIIGGGSAITSSGPGGALSALGFTSPGTGVATALGVNVGSAGAVVVNGGALGTPSSGVATNLTGLPLTTGVTGILPAANGGAGTINGLLKANGSGTVSAAAAGSDYVATETDPVVKAINGLVKSNGSTISAASAGTDYLAPTGSGAGLSGIPTSITGTANQVTASASTGAVTLSLPTDLKIAAIFPASDSTTAIKINKANDSTAVVTVDTTNARVGINKTPGAFDLDVNGAVNVGGAGTFAGTIVQTSNSASAFVSGPNGATNPILQVDASAASAVVGVKVVGGATSGGVQLIPIGGGTNETLFLYGKGTGGTYFGGGIIQFNGWMTATTSSTAVGLAMGSGMSLAWASGTSAGSLAGDTGIGRNGAGIIEANNTTAGTLRDFKARNFLVGTASAPSANDTAVIVFQDNVSKPTLAGTNPSAFYNKGGEQYVQDSSGNETLISPHDLLSNEWIFKSCNERLNKCIKINMEQVVHAVEQLSGKKFSTEWRPNDSQEIATFNPSFHLRLCAWAVSVK